MNRRLSQSDCDDLSAYWDGELSPRRAEQVDALLRVDPAWQDAHRQLQATDRALAAWSSPPCPQDLAGRILAQRRRPARPAGLRVLRWLVPLEAAAAAAIILAAVLLHPPAPVSGPDPAPAAQVAEDFAAKNLDFFQDYDVVANFETLQAIEELESQAPSPSQPEGT